MKIVSIPVKDKMDTERFVLDLVRTEHKVWIEKHKRPDSPGLYDHFICFECHEQNIREVKRCT